MDATYHSIKIIRINIKTVADTNRNYKYRVIE